MLRNFSSVRWKQAVDKFLLWVRACSEVGFDSVFKQYILTCLERGSPYYCFNKMVSIHFERPSLRDFFHSKTLKNGQSNNELFREKFCQFILVRPVSKWAGPAGNCTV